MALAAKKISQLATHMVIAFVVMFVVTGSATFGGIAAIIEPLINVLLLPWHQQGWQRIRSLAGNGGPTARRLWLAEKASQTGLHMLVAFVVMLGATGSLAFGGVAAILEPVCNVIALPWIDRLWQRFEKRVPTASRRVIKQRGMVGSAGFEPATYRV